MKFLSVADIELIHMQIIDATGGSYGVRARDRLESAVAAQTQHLFGRELFVTDFDKAAALCRGIILDHPFFDGNKRTGTLTAVLFLEQRGHTLVIPHQEFEDFAVKIAVDRLEVTAIADWLKSHCGTIKS